MTCDLCEADLPSDYAPQVDPRGRPCLAVCEPCNDQIVRERAQRLGISEVECQADALMDEFAGVLEREIRPRLGH